MSNEHFPRVLSLIASMCESNGDLRELFAKLENMLQMSEDKQQSNQKVQQDVHSLRLDLMLLRKADTIMQTQREEAKACKQIIMSSYGNLSEILGLLSDDMFKNMTRYAALCKQNEVQEKLNQIHARQTIEMEQNAMMENRAIVKKFRESQRLLKEAEDEALAIQLESQELHRQWTSKIERATELRNKKIVSLVRIRKDIDEILTTETTGESQVSKQKTQCSEKYTRLHRKRDPPTLQSALDFLKNSFNGHKTMEQSTTESDGVGTNNNDPAPRSILSHNRSHEDPSSIERIPSPTKQVHFAPLPSSPQFSATSNDSLIQDTEDLAAKMKKMFNATAQELPGDVSEFLDELPEHAIVQRVEVLPPLQLSTIKNLVSDTDEMVHRKPLAKHSFENLFGDKETMNSNEKVPVAPSPQQSMEIDSDCANDSFPNPFNFPPSQPSDDFFLKLFDENSTDSKRDGRSYDL